MEKIDIHDTDFVSNVGRGIKERLPDNTGFALIFFDYDKGTATYVSSVSRRDMIFMLEETLTTLKQSMEPPASKGC